MICQRCKKNEATVKYTASPSDYAHGFVQDICNECYNKQVRTSEWYKQGFKEALEQAINLFKKDSMYTGAVIEFGIRNNLGAEKQEKKQ